MSKQDFKPGDRVNVINAVILTAPTYDGLVIVNYGPIGKHGRGMFVDSVPAVALELISTGRGEAEMYAVIFKREAEPSETAFFMTLTDARAHYERLTPTWTEVLLCKVLDGPRDIYRHAAEATTAPAPEQPLNGTCSRTNALHSYNECYDSALHVVQTWRPASPVDKSDRDPGHPAPEGAQLGTCDFMRQPHTKDGTKHTVGKWLYCKDWKPLNALPPPEPQAAMRELEAQAFEVERLPVSVDIWGWIISSTTFKGGKVVPLATAISVVNRYAVTLPEQRALLAQLDELETQIERKTQEYQELEAETDRLTAAHLSEVTVLKLQLEASRKAVEHARQERDDMSDEADKFRNKYVRLRDGKEHDNASA